MQRKEVTRLTQIVESLRIELDGARKQATEEITALRNCVRERDELISSLRIELSRTSQGQRVSFARVFHWFLNFTLLYKSWRIITIRRPLTLQ